MIWPRPRKPKEGLTTAPSPTGAYRTNDVALERRWVHEMKCGGRDGGCASPSGDACNYS